jgi:TM2 domain-containing membrane protein YozV
MRGRVANPGRIDSDYLFCSRGIIMQKKGFTTFLLWLLCLVGVCGIHRFYVNRPLTGLVWLFTFGLLGFGQLFDLFFLGSMTRQANLLAGLQNGGMNHNNNVNTVAPIFNVHVNVPTAAPVALVAEPTKTA